jgi:para-nitrobenzyl esterase
MVPNEEGRMSTLKIETAAGLVEGVVRGGVSQFLGVAFAAAPLGERRFLAPLSVTPWTGVRRAHASRTSPPQRPLPLLIDWAEQAPADEDCLELNVYTPAADDPDSTLRALWQDVVF